jgi:hypothetical protein
VRGWGDERDGQVPGGAARAGGDPDGDGAPGRVRVGVGGDHLRGGKLAIGAPETLCEWIRRAEVDGGQRPGVTTERQRPVPLARGNREVRWTNGILKAATFSSRGSATHARRGCEARPTRTQRGGDRADLPHARWSFRRPTTPRRRGRRRRRACATAGCRWVSAASERRSGGSTAPTGWAQPNRDGTPVARCPVQRLMRDLGLRGGSGPTHRTNCGSPTS